MFKKFFKIIFPLFIFLVFMSTKTKAIEEYPVWVGGEQVTSEHMSGPGWSYRIIGYHMYALTLTDANITGHSVCDEQGHTANIYINDNSNKIDELRIYLVGTNTLSGADFGIRCDVSNMLIIYGKSLKIQSSIDAINSSAYLIFDQQANLTLTGEHHSIYNLGSVSIYNSDIDATGEISVESANISSNSTLSVRSTNGPGINVEENLSTGGSVTAYSTNDTGINVGGNLEVNGKVFAYGTNNPGVNVVGDLHIYGNTTAYGTNSPGVKTGGNLELGSKSNLTSDSTHSVCIEIAGDMNVKNGGHVVAIGSGKGTGTDQLANIWVGGDFKFDEAIGIKDPATYTIGNSYNGGKTVYNSDGTLATRVEICNVRRYVTIQFVNEDGTVLQSSEVIQGAMPVYTGETPTKPSNPYYTYTFAGWEPEIVTAAEDAIYLATYTAHARTDQNKSEGDSDDISELTSDNENTDNLEALNSPKTGDETNSSSWIALISISFILLILTFMFGKKHVLIFKHSKQ